LGLNRQHDSATRRPVAVLRVNPDPVIGRVRPVQRNRVPVFRVSGFGFRVSGFEFQDSSLESWVFRVSGFGFRVSGFGFRVLGFWFGVLGFGIRVSGLGFRILGFKEDKKPASCSLSLSLSISLSLEWGRYLIVDASPDVTGCKGASSVACKHGTCKTVTARSRPWLSGKSPLNGQRCSLFARAPP